MKWAGAGTTDVSSILFEWLLYVYTLKKHLTVYGFVNEQCDQF